jgi:hypothetical protein
MQTSPTVYALCTFRPDSSLPNRSYSSLDSQLFFDLLDR